MTTPFDGPSVASASARRTGPRAGADAGGLQVVILAAGLGSRLGRDLPKPLTPLADGQTILGRQLTALRAVLGKGVPVTVVVGFRGESVMRAAPDARFAWNHQYASTNTSKSLLAGMRSAAGGGVLWLNGDVVFHPGILGRALPLLSAGQSFVCVDRAQVADEEVKYTLDEHGYVRDLSKSVADGLGEAVGINYVAAADRDALEQRLDACEAQDYFERGMESAAHDGAIRFRPLDISDLPAVEVDIESDLRRANARVLGDVVDVVVAGLSVPRPA